MSSGVQGPKPQPTVTTSNLTKADNTDKVARTGKTSKGETVTVGDNKTPHTDGIAPNATSDTPIEDRYTQPSLEEVNKYLEFLSENIPDDDRNEHIENPADLPPEVDPISGSEVRQAEKESVNALKPFKALKKGFAKLKQAVLKFVNHFRTHSDVGVAVAKAAGQLAEAKVNEGASGQEAAEDVAKMLKSPEALLSGLEQQGMQETVDELRKAFKVATTKNLAKMKSKLMEPEVRAQMKAIEGIDDDKAELIINGALILSKLADPGEGGSIESRRYIFGRIPAEKYDVVKWLLDMEPKAAIQAISSHPRLKGTSVAEGLLESTEHFFETGALRMFEEAETVAELHDNFEAFLKERKNGVMKERRERAGQRYKDIGMAGVVSNELLQEGIKQLKKAKDPDASRDFKLRVQKHTERYGSFAEVAEAAAAKARKHAGRRELEARQAAAKEKLFSAHQRIRTQYDDARGSKLSEEQLQNVTDTYKKLHKEINGLLVTRTKRDGEGWLNRENAEENAARITNAIMVTCGFSVFRSEDSADQIIDTLHGVREQSYEGMSESDAAAAMVDTEAQMAQAALSYVQLLKNEGPDTLVEILRSNPLVAQALK